MKILITGGSGLLGSAVSVYFKNYYDVVSTYVSHKMEIKGCKTSYLDITDAKATKDFIKKQKPDVIVHTSAIVSVDACEKNPELAYKLHVEGTRNIVQGCKETNSKIIYISTDYIFDGKKGMYRETDKPIPINYYGKTKLEGESLIDLKKDAVIRTSIFGWNAVKEKKSFSTWVYDELSSGKTAEMFTDQIKSLILVNDCAAILKEIIESDICGILNATSSDPVSKYEFALKLADVFGFARNLVKPINNRDVPGYEKRPLDVSLDVSKAKSLLKSKLPTVKDGLINMKKLKESNYLENFKVG